MNEKGERKRATISDHVHTISQDQISREDQLSFKLKVDGDQHDDLISHNQLMEYLENNTDTGQLENGFYKFKYIKTTEAHTHLQTLNILEVVTIYLLNGNLGTGNL